MIQGKGGGFRKEGTGLIQLRDDDPLYIALAISMFFLAYATSGGLSLH
jgi:hypothetical protein